MNIASIGLPAVILDPSLSFPIWLTLRVAAITLVVHLVLGTLLAWALSLPRWRGRTLLDTMVVLPMVFPPLALGFLLLMLLGRRSTLGSVLDQHLGISFVFTTTGVVLASVIAGLPLVVKPIEAAITSVSSRLGEASRTLGRSELETFLYVILPNIRPSIVAGLVLGTARSIGEVGITLMLGGNIAGRTNTMSLEVYNAVLATEYSKAVVLSLMLGAGAMVLLLIVRRFGRLTSR